MTRPRRRRLLTLLAGLGVLAVIALAGTYWPDFIARYLFYERPSTQA